LFDVADLLSTSSAAPRPIAPRSAPPALRQLSPDDRGPQLIFPPDGSTVRVEGFGPAARGLSLAAGGRALAWYVNGAPLGPEPVSGKVIWRPTSPGFYKVTVVDAEGRRAQARVRVTAG
jgi:penicillin-binding protein 1C